MNRNKEGLVFYRKPNTEVEILRRYNDKFYLVKEANMINKDSRSDILLTPEDIIKILDNQNEIKEKIKKAIEYHKKQEKEEVQRKEKEDQKQKEYENVYGFCDKMSPMQKGKILKVLNKTYNYYSDGKFIANMSRKDFLKKHIENNNCIKHLKDLKYFTKDGECKIKNNEYRLVLKDNTFYEITKTEYNYANYLINCLTEKAI